MRRVLAGLRLAALVAATLAFIVMQAVWGLPLFILRRPSLKHRMPFFAPWARTALFILGVRVTVHGTPPSPPFLLVSNHLSWLDAVVLASRAPGVFVVMAEAAGWPGIGSACRVAGVIFTDRRRRSDVPRTLGLMREALERKLGVTFFPEGAVSDGRDVGRFRTGLVQIAPETGRPIHYVTVSYETPPGSPGARRVVAWIDEVNALTHFLRLAQLPRIDASLHFGAAPLAGGDRKELAGRLRDAVAEKFVPLAD